MFPGSYGAEKHCAIIFFQDYKSAPWLEPCALLRASRRERLIPSGLHTYPYLDTGLGSAQMETTVHLLRRAVHVALNVALWKEPSIFTIPGFPAALSFGISLRLPQVVLEK